LKRCRGAIAGVLLGYLPAILYEPLGGEGYRILQSSGAIYATDLLEKLKFLCTKLIPSSVWGIPTSLDTLTWPHWIGVGFLYLIFLSAFCFYFFAYRKEWTNFLRFRSGIQGEGFFFCLLTISFLSLTFASTLVAARYLAPLYWVSTIMVGYLLSRLFLVSRLVPIIILLSITFYYSVSAIHRVQTYPKQDIMELVDYLDREGIKGGVTDYDDSYRITFYSGERIKFIPLEGMLRIESYKDYVTGLESKVLIFNSDAGKEKQMLAANPTLANMPRKQFKNYVIYTIDKSIPLRL